MLKITEIVKDGILEIIFDEQEHHTKLYTILCDRGSEIMKGKIAGFTQRTCLYIEKRTVSISNRRTKP
jgi:hypothetical protein